MPACRLCPGMRDKGDRQARISVVAARQHGVVSIQQLREAGISSSAVSRRVRLGWLHPVHRGVYSVGHPGISSGGRWMAACLACGEGAAVSHRSAAALWGLLRAHAGSVDIAIPSTTGRKSRKGIRLHRYVSLRPSDVTRRHGIPTTTPSRTISDLRRVVPAREWRRAIRQAEVLGLPLGDAVYRDRTRSDLECDFLRICKRHRLPTPEVNVRIGSYLVDFVWRSRRLAVETDGYRYHRGRQAFRDDRARDLELRARGFEVIRLSEEQVAVESDRVAEVLREALASARHRVQLDGGQEDRDR